MIKGRKKLDDAIVKLVEEKNKKLRAVFMQTIKDIVFRTPIDTGRARQGWVASVGSPDYSSNGSNSLEAGKVPKFVFGKTVYLANAVDYIEDLEHGTSRQAPNGMVEIALKNARARIDKL